MCACCASAATASRLGIVASPDVRVHRREIYDQIRVANQSALVKPDKLEAVTERLKKVR